MAYVAFGPFVAVDPAYPDSLVRNGSGVVYAVTDTTFTTPLPMRTLAGSTITSVTSNAQGLVDEFEADVPSGGLEANWKAGSYVVRLTSFKAVMETAQAASAAAAAAVQNMGGAARVWGRTIAQGLPTTGDGAQDGDWCLMDAS